MGSSSSTSSQSFASDDNTSTTWDRLQKEYDACEHAFLHVSQICEDLKNVQHVWYKLHNTYLMSEFSCTKMNGDQEEETFTLTSKQLMIIYRALQHLKHKTDIQRCCICMDALCDTQLSCGHLFCSNCILKWREHKDACPMCNSRISMFPNQTIEEVINLARCNHLSV